MATEMSTTSTEGSRFVPSPFDSSVFSKTLTTQDRLEISNSLQGSLIPRISEIAAYFHQDAFDAVLDSSTSDAAIRDTRALLEELADRGFAWSDIAKLLGVSVPAIRKWRTGEAEPTGQNRRIIARLVAFAVILENQCGVENVSAWFETPLVDSYLVTPIDLYIVGRYEAIHEIASGRMKATVALDRFIPEWRDTAASGVDVFTASDGMAAIRLKSR